MKNTEAAYAIILIWSFFRVYFSLNLANLSFYPDEMEPERWNSTQKRMENNS